MPTIKNLLPGSPEPLGPTVTPEGINFAIHSSGATRLELLLFDNITDQRPSQVIPLVARDEPDRRRLAHLRRGASQPDPLQHPRRRPLRPGQRTAPGSTSRKTLIDPYAPASRGDFYWRIGRRSRLRQHRPDDRRSPPRPEQGRQRRRCPALRRLPQRLRLGRRPAPGYPDRGVDHLRGERPRVHPPPLLGERPGGDLPRVHREDPLPEGAGGHRRRVPADHGVRPVRRPVPRPADRRAAGQRLGLQHGRLLRPRVALQLLRQARRAGRRVQDARPRAAQEPDRGDPRRRLQPHPRGEPLRPDDQLQGARQQHLLHAHARARSSTTTSPAAATR